MILPAAACRISWHADAYVCMSNYVFDEWPFRFHLPGGGDVHCDGGNEIERSKMKHSLEDVDRWLYHVRAEVA